MGEISETSAKILIVDNDEKILSILQEYLELCRYQVTTVPSGLDALMLLRSGDYNVLLTDIVMPDISGLGLIEITRKEFPDLPIIAMTGYGRQVKNLTSERSPDYYLEKPFDLTELSEVVHSVLHKE
ncbi:MAG: response regulator [Deltaproteobacteria bacterium]|nr:response regulator [Deltaproteobacteria bacterium]